MVTPPSADGKINPVILAAASIAGIDKIYKLGGAQAIFYRYGFLRHWFGIDSVLIRESLTNN